MVNLLSSDDVERCARTLNVPVAALRAVLAVESAGSGFVMSTDLPRILFEGHVFHRLTDGTFEVERPDLCHPKWTKQHYRGGRGEYDRLLDAIELAADAALMSCSWGLGQVMGFNHRLCGFDHIDDFVNAMAVDEARQLEAMCAFIKANGLDGELRDQAWADFAERYNGPGYKANAYDTKLAAAYAEARRSEDALGGAPLEEDRARVAGLQAALNAAGANPRLAVDGWWGPKTRAAVVAFQRDQGLGVSGRVDAALLDRLGIDDAP